MSAPEESPTEAALALLFADDTTTALQYLPLAFRSELAALPEGDRQKLLGTLLLVRGLEEGGAEVQRRQREGKPEVSFILPRERGTITVLLQEEIVDGARATLVCPLSHNDDPKGAVRVRMIREEGRWRLAGIRGPTPEPAPDSPEALWANLDNPRLAERIQASQRRANESLVIGDIRVMISAEALFLSTSGGYGPPDCLASPESCLPEYAGPPMAMPPYPWTSPRRGYHRTFHSGPQGKVFPPKDDQGSEKRFKSFAIVAVPVEPGKTGIRGFCGDSTGFICVTDDGTAPPVHEGLCVTPCTQLK